MRVVIASFPDPLLRMCPNCCAGCNALLGEMLCPQYNTALKEKGKKPALRLRGTRRVAIWIKYLASDFAIGSNGVPEFVMQLIKRCRAPIGSVWHAQGDRAPRR